MRSLLHVLNVLLVLPVVTLAAAFLIFGHAISTQSWAGFFGVLLDIFIWLLPWGLLVCFIFFVLLISAGLTHHFRWWASLCVALLAAAGAAIVLATVISHDNFSAEQAVFFAPSLVCAAVALWLAACEKRRNIRSAS